MKKTIFIITCLIALFISAFKFNTSETQTDVTAIDILLNPDQTMIDSAKVYNAIMRQNYSGSGSFALDSAHTPHISVLQCFVKTADLKKVFAVVAKVDKTEKPTQNIRLTASGFYYLPFKGLGGAGIIAKPTPELLDFQAKIIEAIKPFIVKGTNADFLQNANGTPIVSASEGYVNGFIPDHSGANFNPHVTVGLAHEDFLKELLAEPFNTFTFKSTSVSIYQLGDFGTAQKKVWTSAKK